MGSVSDGPLVGVGKVLVAGAGSAADPVDPARTSEDGVGTGAAASGGIVGRTLPSIRARCSSSVAGVADGSGVGMPSASLARPTLP
ncbi:MAG: hypothetical protein QOI11_2066, partial [Candidatus Eremiobacteraeota bacterium]|nr:hypothetical protein [Candidatus Eremiobacteraeota bacterium]